MNAANVGSKKVEIPVQYIVVHHSSHQCPCVNSDFFFFFAIKGSAPDLFKLCNLEIVQKADQHPVKKRPFSCLNSQKFRHMKNAKKFNTSDYVVDKEAGLQRRASIYEGIMLQAELSH